MRANRPHTARRAFSMFSMLVVLGLLGVFALLASRLFLSTIRTMRSAQDRQTQTLRIDSVIRALRADVWNATETRFADGALVINRAGQPAVTWTVSNDQTILRTEALSKDSRRWAKLGTSLSFEPRGASVLVRIGQPQAQVLLISQVQLAGGVR